MGTVVPTWIVHIFGLHVWQIINLNTSLLKGQLTSWVAWISYTNIRHWQQSCYWQWLTSLPTASSFIQALAWIPSWTCSAVSAKVCFDRPSPNPVFKFIICQSCSRGVIKLLLAIRPNHNLDSGHAQNAWALAAIAFQSCSWMQLLVHQRQLLFGTLLGELYIWTVLSGFYLSFDSLPVLEYSGCITWLSSGSCNGVVSA